MKIWKRKNILVTGSSRGIGRSIALKFAKEGYDIILHGLHSLEELKKIEQEILYLGVDCMVCIADISNYMECRKMFEKIKERYRHLDILINNAGISYLGLLQEMEEETWDKIIQTNVSSMFYCSKNAIPMMLAQGGGKIINISSIWGCIGASYEVAYSTSKGGINAFSMALAKELAPSHISVNAIACGVIATDMNIHFSKEEKEELEMQIPMGRFGKTEEVADFTYALANQSEYLTGQVIRFDGAWV